MAKGKEQIAKALEEVYYFPKNDNIVNLNMIHNIKVDNNKVNLVLVFPSLPDKSVEIVKEACIKALRIT